MKKAIFFATLIVAMASSAMAHFGMVIPSDQMVMQGENTNISIDLLFWHPFEGHGMDLVKPAVFGVIHNGREANLLNVLEPVSIQGHNTWTVNYKIKRPGVYMFHMEPKPYWEPAEDCFIIHYTKVVVTAFGDDEGWDEEIGLATEIVPLSKPYGLYAGNVFQGVVKMYGAPIPYAEVEVEYFNKDNKYSAPTDYMVTQTVKANQHGVFTYSAPVAGWWGFAALNSSNSKIKYQGEEKDIELGAVIWVNFHDMK